MYYGQIFRHRRLPRRSQCRFNGGARLQSKPFPGLVLRKEKSRREMQDRHRKGYETEQLYV